jgi:hypothetical protein
VTAQELLTILKVLHWNRLVAFLLRQLLAYVSGNALKILSLKAVNFFSVIAMLVLIGEVYYYKRKATKKQKSMLKVVPYTMPSKIQAIDYVKSKNNTILLGHGDFIPVAAAKPRLSHFSGSTRY